MRQKDTPHIATCFMHIKNHEAKAKVANSLSQFLMKEIYQMLSSIDCQQLTSGKWSSYASDIIKISPEM